MTDINRQPSAADPIRVLIVDDEKAARYGMLKVLRPEGYQIAEAEDGLAALRLLEKQDFDVIITDVAMPGISGIDLLTKVREIRPEQLFIIITAHGSERLAVEAMKNGAFDYLSKPYEIDELRLIVGNAVRQIRLQRENERLRNEILMHKGFAQFIGESRPIRQVFEMIDKISKSNVTVLIRGESGTGKEMVAQTIHDQSARKAAPFISINCAAIPRELIESELFGYEKGAFTGASGSKQGRFELAHKGTIFLDEIGDMSLETQAKVLRVLQERKFERVGGTQSIEVDVRIISATHRDLLRAIRDGQFREDLYYRINVVEITLPPLRERDGDVPLLLNHFLKVFASKHNIPVRRFAPEAMKILVDYDWPGNIRELINVVERCVVLSPSDVITPDLLPPDMVKPGSFGNIGVQSVLNTRELTFQEAKQRMVSAFEREFLLEALRLNGWNISQTAVRLGMKRQYLQQKLRELGINLQEEKEQS